MRAPGIIYVATAAPLLPLLGGVLRAGRLPPGRRWFVFWSAAITAANVAALALALQNRNNHWLNYLSTPIAGAIALWALSYWQIRSLPTLSLRLLVPLLGMTWIGIVLRFENTQTFSLLAEPFAGLLIMAATVYTLIARAFAETADLFKQDWFWICVGLALYSGVAVGLPPTSHWLLARHPELVVKAY